MDHAATASLGQAQLERLVLYEALFRRSERIARMYLRAHYALVVLTLSGSPWRHRPKEFDPERALAKATIVTRYFLHLSWRKTFVIAACAALYFNLFVLVVQSFEKVASLKAIAPTQKEPPFVIAQIILLLLFVVLPTFAVKRFRTAA
jgi:hypothetical protein